MSDFINDIAYGIKLINDALAERGMEPISSIRLKNDGAQLPAFGHAVNGSLLNLHPAAGRITMSAAQWVRIDGVMINPESKD